MALDTTLESVETFPNTSTENRRSLAVVAPAARQSVLSPGARAGLTAGLLLQIVMIHLIDQNWFAFAKDPSYLQTGYTLIEITGLIAAGALLVRRDW